VQAIRDTLGVKNVFVLELEADRLWDSLRALNAATARTKKAHLAGKKKKLVRLVCEEKQIPPHHLATLAKRPLEDVERDVEQLVEDGFLNMTEVLKCEEYPWLTPTREGLRRTGFRPSMFRAKPVLALLNHVHLIVAHRIYYMRKLRGWRWTSERVYSGEGAGLGRRLPDGVLRRGKESIAVEIELTGRSVKQVEKNILSLAKHHTKVHIHCSDEIREKVQAIRDTLGVKNVFVLELEADHLWNSLRAEGRDA
jgi:hypothetical protein